MFFHTWNRISNIWSEKCLLVLPKAIFGNLKWIYIFDKLEFSFLTLMMVSTIVTYQLLNIRKPMSSISNCYVKMGPEIYLTIRLHIACMYHFQKTKSFDLVFCLFSLSSRISFVSYCNTKVSFMLIMLNFG